MSTKGKATIIIGMIAIITIFVFSGMIVERNGAGFYQVKQGVLDGKLTTKMSSGPYMQMFGEITTYKQVATVGFGDEKGEGSADIKAIPVMFNDGSKAHISGLVRIGLPTTPEQLIRIKQKYSGGYEHFIRSGVVPVVTNAVKLSANLRSAQDAYTTLALFQQSVDDQLRNGIYKTRSDVKKITRSTGETETIKLTEIVTDKTGEPVRVSNIFSDIGCAVEQCVISVPKFDKQVEDMIAKRKDEAMATELAKQAAIRAQQDKLTIEEQGKAAVAKVKYEKEKEKIAAVTTAEKELAVAKLDRAAAAEVKQKLILEGQGEAAKKRAIMLADGALAQKLKTYEAVQARWAEAIEKAGVGWVPQIIMGDQAGGKADGASQLIQMLNAKTARELALDMDMKKKK